MPALVVPQNAADALGQPEAETSALFEPPPKTKSEKPPCGDSAPLISFEDGAVVVAVEVSPPPYEQT